MCGWVAVLGRTAPEPVLRAAGDLLATRGPDGRGERVVEGPLPCGLAHRRLAILDPSPAGAQPMVDADRGLSVVYNGERYNAPALRAELVARGRRFRSTSDTEVLLAGWAEWGDAVLDRIEGIFSFALVDERRGRALLARDRLGVKPLYWAQVGDTVVAGSAPRGLLALEPSLGAELDRTALAQYLTLLWIPHPRTPWTRIAKLEPGHALVVEPGSVRRRRYWSPPEPGATTLEPAVLRDVLRAATHRQLLSDVPVGALFSGGLDSTLLVAFMVERAGGGRLRAVTAGYDAGAQQLELVPDDPRYARAVAAADVRLELVEVRVGADAERDLDALAPHFDDPVADPAALTLRRLCEAAGVKVLVSGVGGEELFGGYPRHGALGPARRAAGLPSALRRAGSLAAGVLFGGRPGPGYAARRNLQKLLRAVADPHPHYWRMMSQLTTTELEALMPGAATAAVAELDAQCPPLARTTLADALVFDRAQFLPNLNLAYVDKASMAVGVEVRVPLLDEAVVASAFAADPAGFVVDGITKAPLKAAARGVVPDAIVDRPKSGFGGPARSWFRGPGARDLVERIDAVADAGLVAREPARRVGAAAVSGRRDAALAAWALVCLQAWYDCHGGPSGAGRR
jgi:asparagine synthase (glutamine-hydrolysing)